jgi:hypothetical protein
MMGVVLAGGACRLFSPDAEIVFGQGGLEIGCGGQAPGRLQTNRIGSISQREGQRRFAITDPTKKTSPSSSDCGRRLNSVAE